ncbi:hypothetical protein M3B74_20480 [Citrobacter freundii]|uniref:hypothetical protein n=1 Tax=Citrobacter TaxID=544 RepID=UPI000F4FC490|nr:MULTISPECIES: hypothetical protein [Citrobacter]HED2482656.1 hypothetical protein [Citrobacter youngae]AYY47123.1 hypothetical protein EGX89_00390 [Citrobacter freundii]MBJ9559391.1 hypothetical protein [Citrobacter sp. FDAARGOS_156]MCT1497394.1 hypothetical protein [Citrobacter freundii]MDU7352003.1 hypothetical protein [Citrobacter freundii]
MPKFQKEKIEPKSYAVNNTTLFAALGLFFFGFSGFILVINATVRLFASVWMYSFGGSDAVRAGMTFFLATICFALAVLCRKGFRYCLFKLKQNQIQN